MALVGNKADLESQREVSREVSTLSSFMQIPCVLMMTSAVALIVLVYSSGYCSWVGSQALVLVLAAGSTGVCRQQWHVFYRNLSKDS